MSQTFPAALCALPQWILWRGIPEPKDPTRTKKLPINARTLRNASSTNAKTWADYASCVAALPAALEAWEADDPAHRRGGGLGFVFTPDDPYFGLDLDGVRDPTTGTLAPWAAHLVHAFGTYTEISPSGAGVHLLGQGTIGEGKNRKPLEIYDRGRYFTMTGQALTTPAAPLVDCTPQLAWLLPTLEVLAKALQRAGDRLSLLFAGQWERTGDRQGVPYASASNADLAFCSLLRQAGASQEHCDALMRLSGLYRPKWDERHGARTYGAMTLTQAFGGPETRTNGRATPPQDPAPPPGTRPQWWALLDLNTAGKPIQTYPNIGIILDHHPHWQDPAQPFWYDEARGEYMRGETVISEEDISRYCERLGQQTGMRVTSDKMVSRAVNVRCKDHPRDLLRHALDALPPWDGVERLAYWLDDYAGVRKTAYTMKVAQILPVAMIARGYEPGCQYRYVVVLCGPENSGKTKLLRALATQEWFLEMSCSLEGKEAHLLLRGVWLAELSELESMGRTGENRLKSYITMEADDYIPKFSNRRERVQRRTVFAGTTNESEFLKGQTGNTRYLPVQCGDMNPDAFIPQRLQILAEAKTYYHAHRADWWQLGEEAEAEAITERERRREKSPYEDRLASEILSYAYRRENTEGTHRTFLAWPTMIMDHWGVPIAQQTQSLVYQINKALRALHWTYEGVQERLTYNGKEVRVRPWTMVLPRDPRTGTVSEDGW